MSHACLQKRVLRITQTFDMAAYLWASSHRSCWMCELYVSTRYPAKSGIYPGQR